MLPGLAHGHVSWFGPVSWVDKGRSGSDHKSLQPHVLPNIKVYQKLADTIMYNDVKELKSKHRHKTTHRGTTSS